MSTIVTRAGKGSPLTNTEVDSNFTNLNTDKVESITSADGSVVVSTSGTTRDLSVGIAGSTATLISQVRNQTGATLTKGTLVYISGASGNKALVSKALATGDATSAQTYGMVQADIPHNQNGYLVVIGVVSGLNTSTFTEGVQLYLSPTTAGTYTSTKPYAPQHLVYVGVVTRSHANQGTIEVKIQNGYEMDELHNVSAQSPTNGQTLVYNTTTSLWEKNTVSLTAGVNGTLPVANGGTGQTSYTDGQLLIGNTTGNTLAKATLTAGTGISVTNGAGAITVTNSAPDQTVALTGAGATSITGTYPNFTISSVNTTYGTATSTVNGLVELGSDTVQTVAANAVSATASRSYALQLNSDGQGVVNVPWTDTNSGGTVTSITAGTGLSGSTITTSGTIALANTAVTAGSYTSTNLTVDAQGRITAASSGTGGGVTSVTGTAPVVSSGGTTPAISMAAASSGVNGYMTGTYATKLDGIATGATANTGTVTSVSGTGTVSGLTLTGTVTGSGNLTLGGSITSVPATSVTNLYSPNGATAVSGDAATAMPSTANSLIHTLGTGPSGNDGHIIGMSWTGAVYGAQIWLDTDPTNRMAIRSRSNAGVWNAWSEVLTALNYNSYAPTLTGTGASGTWGISVTGNSATVGGITPNQFFNNMGNNHGTYTNFNSVPNFGVYYLQNSTNGPTGIAGNQFYGVTLGLGNDYALSSYGSQIYYPRRAQNSQTYIYIRDMEGGTWTSWTKIRAGYADSSTRLYASDSSYTFDGANPYYMAMTYDGTRWLLQVTPGTPAAVRVSYADSAGAADFAGLSNKAGGTGSYITSGDYRAPIFYDSADTGYYLNPNGSSYLSSLILAGAAYFRPNNWIQLEGDYGIYSSVYNSAHLLANISSSYTQWRIIGSRGGYGGIYDTHSAVAGMMYDSAGNGGVYREANGRWYWYYLLANDCMGIGTSSTSSTYSLYLNKGVFAQSRIDATIYYDTNNTGYYLDPNGTSQLSYVLADNWFRPQGATGVYWQSYGRGIRGADAEFSYGNIGTYDAGLNGWRGYGIWPNNCVLMANGSEVGIYNPSGGLWIMNCNMSGSVTFNGNVTASSDLRLKQNVREIDNVIERRNTLALSAIKYERDGRTRIGYGAQTLMNNGCPEFVLEADDQLKVVSGLGSLSVDYGETAAVLAVTSKMTDDRLTALEAKVAQLMGV